MEFAFYNVTSIRGFTFMLTVVCTTTRIRWAFPTASKIASVRIIRFILKIMLNGQHPYKRLIVDKDSALSNSTDVTNLLFDDFKISMETTGSDDSWINVNNERHNRRIHNMLIAGLLDINNHKNKSCCAAETSEEVHRFRIQSAIDNISPNFAWYNKD